MNEPTVQDIVKAMKVFYHFAIQAALEDEQPTVDCIETALSYASRQIKGRLK
jgi:hypothetical protein